MDGGVDLVDDIVEFVVEDIVFVYLENGVVEQMKIGIVNGGVGYFEDDVVGFDDFWFGNVNCC